MKLPTRRVPKPALDMTQTDFEKLLVRGLQVKGVVDDCITWSSPPTEAEKAFAAEILSKKVTHHHA